MKHRRQHKKREWQKGGRDGLQGRQFWREKGEGDGDGGEGAAGPGPGSAQVGRDGANTPHERSPRDAKAQAQPAGRADKPAGGSGPGSEAATTGEGRSHKKRQQPGGGLGADLNSNGKRRQLDKGQQQQRPQQDLQQARLASYAVPTLKKEAWADKHGQGKKPKAAVKGQAAQAGNEAPADGLSRAQRKNLKRSVKRASKRGAGAGGGD